MTIYGSITNETLAEVGASWVQNNRDRFGWTKIPRCRVLGRGNGHGTTTYSLPALDNFLAKANSLADWGYGHARRAPRDLNSTSITVTPLPQDIQPLTRPLTSNASVEQVFADLTNNIIPGQLSMLYQGMEKRLGTILTTDSTYSTAVTFSGTGALDTYMTNSNHDPIGDILAALESNKLRVYAEIIGGKIAMFVSPRVIDLFQRHPAFNGSGAASGVAQVVPRQVVYQHLQAVLGIDEVIELNAVADTVRAGQTSAPQRANRSVLSFRVLDRMMDRNLAANPFDTPEGSLCLFEAEPANVTTAEDRDTKVIKFNGDVEYEMNVVRGATWGIHFAASEMFT